jgi:hypothetical protein
MFKRVRYFEPSLEPETGPEVRSGWQVNLEQDFGPVQSSSGSKLSSKLDCGITNYIRGHYTAAYAPWVYTRLCNDRVCTVGVYAVV